MSIARGVRASEKGGPFRFRREDDGDPLAARCGVREAVGELETSHKSRDPRAGAEPSALSCPCVLTFFGTRRIGVANEVVQPVMTGLDQPPSSIDGVSRPRRSASMVVCP
jgi:hypothetical protein